MDTIECRVCDETFQGTEDEPEECPHCGNADMGQTIVRMPPNVPHTPDKPLMLANFNGMDISSDGVYVWMKLEHGQVQIKLDDEGVVVDVFDRHDESVASTYATYSELED